MTMQRLPIENLENAAGNQDSEFYRELLVEHVLKPWFPRCIDRTYGGFLCDFDRRWRSLGPDDKLLEFQARQTLTAAEAVLAFPSDDVLREATSVGFAFLRNVMWDREYGGWFQSTDRQGHPRDGEMKHTHGQAYGIEACLAVFVATGEDHALELAIEGFEWVDDHAHDDIHGGYFGPLNRDGTVTKKSGPGTEVDFIGTPIGLKDMDVNKDLFAAFSYAACCGLDRGRMRDRFDELLEIALRHFVPSDADPHFFFHPDWTPATPYSKPSEMAQITGYLIEARPLSANPETLEEAALDLLLVADAQGWSKRAGAFLFDCSSPRRHTLPDRYHTPWWAQFEFLKAAEYLRALRPDDERIAAIAARAREAAVRFVDRIYSGMTVYPIDALPPFDRFFRREQWHYAHRKGDWWKDTSHEGRALLRLASLESRQTI